MCQFEKKTQYQIIIVGAGSAGMCCSIRAAERGIDVLVIEKILLFEELYTSRRVI